jgi:hypothetical protein
VVLSWTMTVVLPSIELAARGGCVDDDGLSSAGDGQSAGSRASNVVKCSYCIKYCIKGTKLQHCCIKCSQMQQVVASNASSCRIVASNAVVCSKLQKLQNDAHHAANGQMQEFAELQSNASSCRMMRIKCTKLQQFVASKASNVVKCSKLLHQMQQVVASNAALLHQVAE